MVATLVRITGTGSRGVGELGGETPDIIFQQPVFCPIRQRQSISSRQSANDVGSQALEGTRPHFSRRALAKVSHWA